MKIRAKFKGKDGSVGYLNGENYDLIMKMDTWDRVEYIEITQIEKIYGLGHYQIRKDSYVPYQSLKAFLNNWQVLILLFGFLSLTACKKDPKDATRFDVDTRVQMKSSVKFGRIEGTLIIKGTLYVASKESPINYYNVLALRDSTMHYSVSGDNLERE